jgi:glycosyltransferase involved in cell wall biosynthesis
MSTGKAILAIGPESIGSVSYLRDVAACVSDADQMEEVLFRLLEDPGMREKLGSRSRGKYIRNHNRAVLQQQFAQHVFESGVNG